MFLLAACGSVVKTTSISQPNPVLDDRVGWEESIVTQDMEMSYRFYMVQKAWFNVVSPNRIRFHIQLMHKWEEFADLRGWDITLTDDRGRVIKPEVDLRSNKSKSTVWDHELQTAQRNEFGDVVKLNNDGYKQRVSMESVSAFYGRGDCLFTAKDLFTKETKKLTLRMTKGSTTYVFEWNFWLPSESTD